MYITLITKTARRNARFWTLLGATEIRVLSSTINNKKLIAAVMQAVPILSVIIQATSSALLSFVPDPYGFQIKNTGSAYSKYQEKRVHQEAMTPAKKLLFTLSNQYVKTTNYDEAIQRCEEIYVKWPPPFPNFLCSRPVRNWLRPKFFVFSHH